MSLTTRQLEQAIRYNPEQAGRVGWLSHYPQVAAALGFGATRPSVEEFSLAVGAWQANHRPLKPDGKLGANTWSRIQQLPTVATGASTPPDWLVPASAPEPAGRTGTGPEWLRIAQSEQMLWDRERRGDAEAHMSRDEEYFQASPYYGARVRSPGVVPRNQDRRDWCAAFVNWCLHNAGYSHTGSAGAHSFAVAGQWQVLALAEPRPGCVVVVSETARGEHVGFLLRSRGLPSDPGGNVEIRGHRGRQLEMLGGNQSQRVSVNIERRTMLACRDRHGNRSPYLWPERGAANCNHLPPSESGHFCGRIHAVTGS
jgi:uncharacterized protein (TIGR02594 family)